MARPLPVKLAPAPSTVTYYTMHPRWTPESCKAFGHAERWDFCWAPGDDPRGDPRIQVAFDGTFIEEFRMVGINLSPSKNLARGIWLCNTLPGLLAERCPICAGPELQRF